MILADTEGLHQRISLLEVALAQSYSKHNTRPHPLLAAPYLFTSRQRRPGDNNLAVFAEEEDAAENTLGTLTIGSEGEARFVGSFAGSEYLRDGEGDGGDGEYVEDPVNLATPPFAANEQWTRQAESQPRFAQTHIEMGLLDSIVPGHSGSAIDIEALQDQLPEWETEGRMLVESYWENVNWM